MKRLDYKEWVEFLLPNSHPMEYLTYQQLKQLKTEDRKPIVLLECNIENYHCVIISYRTHPCAYIEIPADHPYYKKDWEEVDLPVHGGVSYSDFSIPVIKNKHPLKSWYLGWDYNHFEDYYPFSFLVEGEDDELHKWTIEEILNHDLLPAVEKLIKVKEKGH